MEIVIGCSIAGVVIAVAIVVSTLLAIGVFDGGLSKVSSAITESRSSGPENRIRWNFKESSRVRIHYGTAVKTYRITCSEGPVVVELRPVRVYISRAEDYRWRVDLAGPKESLPESDSFQIKTGETVDVSSGEIWLHQYNSVSASGYYELLGTPLS